MKKLIYTFACLALFSCNSDDDPPSGPMEVVWFSQEIAPEEGNDIINICAFDPSSGRSAVVVTLPAEYVSMYCMDLSPDCSRIVGSIYSNGDDMEYLRIVDLSTGAVSVCRDTNEEINDVAWSPDGWIYFGHGDRIRPDGSSETEDVVPGRVNPQGFTPDGKVLSVVDGTGAFWATPPQGEPVEVSDDIGWGIALNDQQALVTVGEDIRLGTVALEAGATLSTFTGHSYCRYISISPSRNRIAYETADGLAVCFWNGTSPGTPVVTGLGENVGDFIFGIIDRAQFDRSPEFVPFTDPDQG